MGLRAMRERRPIVIADPAAAPRFGPVYERLGFRTVNFVPLLFRDEHVGLLVLYHRTPYDWSPDELELCTSFANQMATAFANARLFATVREGAARLRAIQELSSRLNRIQDVEKIGDAIVAEADRLIRHDTIRVYTRRPGDRHVRADRVPRRGLGDRRAQPRGPPPPDRRGADGLGRRAQRDDPPRRRGRRSPGPPAGHRPRGGVDAPGADVVRVARARRDRRVQGGLRPVRRGRPADARDLRRLRGPGGGQRRGVRAGPAPAGRAPPPPREPAPPARGQRAPARHPRPERRARDDRGQPQGRRLVRRAHRLPRRPWRGRPARGPGPRPLRRGHPPARGTDRRRHHGLGDHDRRDGPRQRRPPRPPVRPDPGHARGAGVDAGLPAVRGGRRRHRHAQRGAHGRRRLALQPGRVRAGPAVRGPGIHRAPQRRGPRRRDDPGRARCADRAAQPRGVPARGRGC